MTAITRESKEVKDFARLFHYGVLGIEKTTRDVRETLEKVLASGFQFKAWNTEMNLAQYSKDILQGRMRLHVPISYPMGNMTLKKKMKDLEYCVEVLQTDEDCVCLNYGHIMDHQYDRVEDEVRQIETRFGALTDLAYVIQATLLTDNEIVDVCRAIQNGGSRRIKVNTGYQWGTSPEEVALIRRVFGYSFDIHPSGNIKTLKQVQQFLELGVQNIHSLACFEIIDEYIALRNQEEVVYAS
jgi:deoxyribose-phosphate aldolase